MTETELALAQYKLRTDIENRKLKDSEDLEDCGCGFGSPGVLDSVEHVRIAAIAKYGGDGKTQEAAINDFLKVATQITEGQLFGRDCEPTLTDKLEALKKEVGEDTFKGLLSNPRVESLANAAWQRADDIRANAALTEIAALFNGAVSRDDIACFLSL